ncbi:MAG: acyl carrier protein [Candidatus Heimdallarchaeaceae archaeon]
MYKSIANRLRKIVGELTGVNPKYLSLSTSIIKTLHFDDKEMVKLRKKIEEEFDVNLPKNIFHEFHTIGELVGFIETEIGMG